MRACPKCGERMAVAQTITVGGLENKDIAWRCDRDSLTAELRHPVQYVHINPGDIDEVDGRRRKLVHKEIRGAELVVYHQWLPADGGAPAAPKRPPRRARTKAAKPARARKVAARSARGGKGGASAKGRPRTRRRRRP